MAPSPGMSCTHTVRAWAAGEDLHAARSPPRVSHRALLTTGSLPPAHTPTPTSASQIQAGHLPGWLQPQVFVTCSSTSTSICLHPPCILPCIQLPDWTPPHIPTHASSIRGGCPDLEVDGEEAVRERGMNAVTADTISSPQAPLWAVSYREPQHLGPGQPWVRRSFTHGQGRPGAPGTREPCCEEMRRVLQLLSAQRGKNLCKKMMKRNRSLNDLLDGM
ncbi:uncharacterized protein LOC133044772 isoform X2 [Dama dama]|uniref:uncharacterized protein LOC133044772 isoform X2 n=1 Tax=Dama dama TaxID=30532 RepID=UPI002A35B5CF|nr:uncharacterized protein LOC133044772 isoform X2 [Dama dama]